MADSNRCHGQGHVSENRDFYTLYRLRAGSSRHGYHVIIKQKMIYFLI